MINLIIPWILVFSFSALVFWGFQFLSEKRRNDVAKLREELEKKEESYKQLLSQKKSSEIILGQITEKLAPFLQYFTWDPQQAQFMGNPVDYIVFGDEEISFVEIKSGNAQLSIKQRKIKDLIKKGKVGWYEIKIK